MTPPSGFHDPAIKPIREWCSANQGFYARFRCWLRDGGYSDSALALYGVAARLALGQLEQPYWLIDPEVDLDRVRAYVKSHYDSAGTRQAYFKGLAKLADYLRHCCQRPAPPKEVNWYRYLEPLPDWLASDVRTYVQHQSRGWLPEEARRLASSLLGVVTRFPRWAVDGRNLETIADLSPELWFDYLDARLEAGISPVTLNTTLAHLQSFLQFLAEQGRPVCRRMLQVERLKQGPRLPRDVPVGQLTVILQEIEKEAAGEHVGLRRMGLMDRAWFLLMLHCGLRSGEVRRLRLPDLDIEGGRSRIEQSKGLKDRVVYLSRQATEALEAYLPWRGPMTSDHVFTFRHASLTYTYCSARLRTYGERCGVQVRCHQLRHSCATLLLNAGAPILTVQTILGHKHIDTTLGYARLYDGTVAADYYRAMNVVEARLALVQSEDEPVPDRGQLLALVDALSSGTLNDRQKQTVQALREGILALAEQWEPIDKGELDY
jgi:integrase/recombinase XerD